MNLRLIATAFNIAFVLGVLAIIDAIQASLALAGYYLWRLL